MSPNENKSFSMHLPVGDQNDEYRSHILVRITDGFGDYAEYVLLVAIFPSKVVRDALDGKSSFTDVSAYLKLLEKNITVAHLSGHITRSVRCIESAASNIALIPLPYQGITLFPDDLYLIGFYKDEFERKVPFTWEKYWQDFVKPRDKRQQAVLQEVTSLMSKVSLQLCHQALNKIYVGTYTISSLASSMADLISGPDYISEGVLVCYTCK
ncbi:hypothetical protein CHS0354_020589 [Potamilus streckersoni]|uniref:Uncharacterized protein n=1 Tax=Potamilus streckersoni TaxID=2493646 RepID=A0AAE0VHL8_9BIVA|nr:hypothetical protein CHS0354_020589 [Potamilus streckersoni]